MRDKGTVLVCVVLPLFLALTAFSLAGSSRFVLHHPQGPLLHVSRDGIVRVADHQLPLGPTRVKALQPRVDVENTVHDFGVMNPLSMGRKDFLIRNVGSDELTLQKGSTSCKCTLSRLTATSLPPGGTAEVTVEWNTGRDRIYAHEALIHTNDPQHPTISLKVQGLVRVRAAASPPEAAFGSLQPGQRGSAEVIIYSQLWDSIEITESGPSLEEVTWTARPLPASETGVADARSAARLTISIPDTLPLGNFQHTLRLQVRPPRAGNADAAEFEEIEIPLRGAVLGRVAVYGAEIDDQGTIQLGPLPKGQALRKQFLVKVRDDVPHLELTGVKSTPPFLALRLLPYKADSGLQILELQIPHDAPVCSYLGSNPARLHLELDHPRVSVMDLKVCFAILAP